MRHPRLQYFTMCQPASGLASQRMLPCLRVWIDRLVLEPLYNLFSSNKEKHKNSAIFLLKDSSTALSYKLEHHIFCYCLCVDWVLEDSTFQSVWDELTSNKVDNNGGIGEGY